MPSIDDFSERKYMKASDVEGSERTVNATGVRVEELEELDTKKKHNKLVLDMSGEDRSLVLNMTNSRAIAESQESHDDYTLWEFPIEIQLSTYPTAKGTGIMVKVV